MADQIIEFWSGLATDANQKIHPRDEHLLQNFAAIPPVNDFQEFMISDHYGLNNPTHLHLSLLPQPYSGNMRTADIFILLLNPGLNLTDYWAEFNNAEFRHSLEDTISQQNFDPDFPFIWLNPKFCWHSGFVWWEKKFRKLASLISEQQYNGNYHSALRALSQRLACVELFPYHSTTFGAHALLGELPSTVHARDFVARIAATDKTIIATRQAAMWGLPDRDNTIVYSGGHSRAASLGPQSEGGRAILQKFGIEIP